MLSRWFRLRKNGNMPSEPVKPDRSKIHLDNAAEVKSWCKRFGISEKELIKLVERLGNSAATVRKEVEWQKTVRTSGK